MTRTQVLFLCFLLNCIFYSYSQAQPKAPERSLSFQLSGHHQLRIIITSIDEPLFLPNDVSPKSIRAKKFLEELHQPNDIPRYLLGEFPGGYSYLELWTKAEFEKFQTRVNLPDQGGTQLLSKPFVIKGKEFHRVVAYHNPDGSHAVGYTSKASFIDSSDCAFYVPNTNYVLYFNGMRELDHDSCDDVRELGKFSVQIVAN